MSLRAAIEREAANVAGRTKAGFGDLLEVYDAAWKIADELSATAAACDYEEAINVSKRLAIIANSLPAVLNVQNAVLGGFYFNAASGLRQIMEAMARVAEIREQRPQFKNATPNVSALPLDLAKSYGPLSAISHSTTLDLTWLEELCAHPDESGAVSPTPVYRHNIAKNLLGLLLTNLLVLLTEWYDLEQNSMPVAPDRDVSLPFKDIFDRLVQLGYMQRRL